MSYLDSLNLLQPLMVSALKIDYNPLVYNAKDISTDIENKIDSKWSELTNKNDKILFNDLKFRLYASKINDNKQLELKLGLTDYKHFIGTQQSLPDITCQLQSLGKQVYSDDRAYLSYPLGVGLLLITSDNKIVLLKRSLSCAESPEIFDRPGGHPEPK
ncbi:unnamed protein product [Didymodactylos carnosus]|uniref:Nudix hydrolase domain-containing protein n=1 Tax=Didymodactylos carnosus TaxID=1234261 RepID=A0A813TP29_9BILA|nr:unnamed protein product [Didymodactylos carnosus]CAF1352779.1 unnamed protein product [Didymodactylos carnosus]CAF3596682.1 unnamed protein product [Didymodactylos carnosus]CAF4163252.1 unnamed protein product [Didymodactylos carnosus]